jgi:hypothetical protein
VQLDLATAETLSKLGIDLADAEAGQVKQMPKVKGVVPANPQDLTTPPPSTQPPVTTLPPQNR